MRCIEEISDEERERERERESCFHTKFFNEEIDFHCKKENKKNNKAQEEGDSTLGNHRHATKLFRGYRGTKSAGTCINAEKMRG